MSGGDSSRKSVFSDLLSAHQPNPVDIPRRAYHIDLGAREKALLDEDAALKRFESYKNTVKRVGNALTVLIVAALVIF